MYASVTDVEERMGRALSESEQSQVTVLLEDAAVMIDAYNETASSEIKKLVSCRMVIRTLGSDSIPIGATQGTISALGYSQTWVSGGSSGELYLGRAEKKLLGGDKIGTHSPVEDICTV